MNGPDTLFSRCTMAFTAASQANAGNRRAAMAALLEHLAYEFLVLHQHDDRLTVHELHRLLLEAAREGK